MNGTNGDGSIIDGYFCTASLVGIFNNACQDDGDDSDGSRTLQRKVTTVEYGFKTTLANPGTTSTPALGRFVLALVGIIRFCAYRVSQSPMSA
jgi:hypothetical protein